MAHAPTPGPAPPLAPDAFETRPFLFESARAGYRTPPDQLAHAQFGLSDGRHKVVLERYESTRAALYDLVRDPGEAHPETEGPEVDAAVARLRAAFGLCASSGCICSLDTSTTCCSM